MLSLKLDLLMKVTNTKNSTLGRALSFDSSYIGRIRSGKRGLPKHQPFIVPAAAFFAEHIQEPYQKQTVAEAVCPGRPWPEDRAEAEARLVFWLSNEAPDAQNTVNQILRRLAVVPAVRQSVAPIPLEAPVGTAGRALFYYGVQGKRDAVEAFLHDLCALHTPVTLLLCSDEDMEWMFGDAEFAARLGSLLMELLARGGHIQIIHTVRRGIREMLESVRQWLPLYMTGSIDPYYYPKPRDGVCRRSLFIAQGHSALTSNSIGDSTQQTLNTLILNPDAARALETEFREYAAMCKPLMRIFSPGSGAALLEDVRAFESARGNLIAAHPAPSLFTMPEDVAKSIAARCGGTWVLDWRKRSEESFFRHLAAGETVTELLRLPEPEQVRAGNFSVPMSDLFGHPMIAYSADELKRHLKRVVTLLRTEKNYRVMPSNASLENVILYAREGAGVLLVHAIPPTTAFSASVPSMTEAFSEYLRAIVERGARRSANIQWLEDYIGKL